MFRIIEKQYQLYPGVSKTRIDNIKLSPYNDNFAALKRAVEKKLGASVADMRVLKRSVDARKKNDIKIIYSIECVTKGEHLAPIPEYPLPKLRSAPRLRPIVCGSGPAGMLAALTLALAGARPIVIERGPNVDERTAAVERYFTTGKLNSESNVQFGEGGAGTFSDGKLTTGIKDRRIQFVLDAFVRAGAPEEILWQSKPHIGTDMLKGMVANIRKRIISLGGEYLFNTKLENIITKNGKLCGAVLKTASGAQPLDCDSLILAVGHSARDTFQMLYDAGIEMTQKPFSVGVRIEHPQSMINRSQYAEFASCPALGAADYKLSHRLSSGRGVYTFCMCPGGAVVAAASEPNSIVTNGMSYFARSLPNANSALLVSVSPEDFCTEHPLAGIEYQRCIERAAYRATSCAKAPAQLFGDLLEGRASTALGSVNPSYRPGVVLCDISSIFPGYITDGLKEGILAMGKKLSGFDMHDALLTAPETRSSSPVRILRDERLQSSIAGIYPCGEGAGFAGGIMSAACDGIRCAEALIAELGGTY